MDIIKILPSIIAFLIGWYMNGWVKKHYGISIPSLIINRLGSAFGITDVTDPIIKFIEHPSKDEIDRKFWDDYMHKTIFESVEEQKVNDQPEIESEDLTVYGQLIDEKTVLTDEGEIIVIRKRLDGKNESTTK